MLTKIRTIRRQKKDHSPGRKMLRSGVAAVETAVTLPLLILLVFGAIEVSNGIFLTQALSFASYEGAREATKAGATSAHVAARVADVLHARGVHDYNILITPTLNTQMPRGTQITVQVRAPMNALSSISTAITKQRMASQQVTMVKH